MGQHRHNRGQRRLTVTVCIPTIPGRERFLLRAKQSVAAQTRPPDHVLVGLDRDRRGAAATRNALLKQVVTDAVAWLDDDDWLAPGHLRACMRVLENSPEVGLVYPAPVMEGGQDPTAVTYQGVFPTSPWGLRWQPELAQHIRDHGSFIPITHVVRTGAVRRAGGFPEGVVLSSGRYRGEDEGYLLALLDAGAVFEHLDRRTWHWYVNPRSTAGRGTRV